MPIPRLAVLTLAATLTIGGVAAFAQDVAVTVDPAIATMSVDDKVTARQQAMKEDGRLIRGAAQASGDDAVKIAGTVLQNFTNFPALFAGNANNTISEASSDIWQEFDQFTALFTRGQADAKTMLDAAKAGDNAAYLASLKDLSPVCGECHQRYRID